MSDIAVLVILTGLFLVNLDKQPIYKTIGVLMCMYLVNIAWSRSTSPIWETELFFVLGLSASAIACSFAFIATRRSGKFLSFVPLLFVLTLGMLSYSAGFFDYMYLESQYKNKIEFFVVEVLVYLELIGVALVSFGNGLSKYTEYICSGIIQAFSRLVRLVYPVEIHQSSSGEN